MNIGAKISKKNFKPGSRNISKDPQWCLSWVYPRVKECKSMKVMNYIKEFNNQNYVSFSICVYKVYYKFNHGLSDISLWV